MYFKFVNNGRMTEFPTVFTFKCLKLQSLRYFFYVPPPTTTQCPLNNFKTHFIRGVKKKTMLHLT